MPEVKMTPVKSSTIELVGYDPKAQELHVKFKSGDYTYVYSNIDPGLFSSFMNAKSKGLFHHEKIKGNVRTFPFRKIRPVLPQL